MENFNRTKEEVDTLFGLLRDKLKMISDYEDSYARYNKVRIRIIGNRGFIPPDILKDLEYIEEVTKSKSSKKILNVCFPYTARDEITHAVRSVAKKGLKERSKVVKKLTPKLLSQIFTLVTMCLR